MGKLSRNKLKKLIGSGKLSGMDVAKIALSEMWDGDHGRDGFLTHTERKAAVDGLTDDTAISAYNNWFGAFQTIRHVNNMAHISSLEVQNACYSAELILKRYLSDDRGAERPEKPIFGTKRSLTPMAIMTCRLKDIQDYMGELYFFNSLLSQISKITGLDFCGDICSWIIKAEIFWDRL